MKKEPKYLRVLFWAALFFWLQTPIQAQPTTATRTVTGKVTDATDGSPLSLVTITVKGQSKSTTSNEKGEYKLTVTGENVILIFSHINFASQEVPLKAGINEYDVILNTNVNDLEGVVVVGYGTVKRRDVTGSIGSVNVENLQKAPVASFEDALAGRVAGVRVNAADGQPGAAASIVIRGSNSITQSNSPLYVIDGFPVEDPENNVINVSEIESFEILKDASATAIYGARGANGVIIITTKRGKQSEPVVTYQGWVGVQQNAKKQSLLNAYEFVKAQLELNPALNTPLYLSGGKTLESYRNEPSLDWQDQMFKNAVGHNHSLAVRGGTAKTKYSLSGSVFTQDGIILNSGFNRYQGRFSIDQSLGSKFKVGMTTNYTSSKTYGELSRVSNNPTGSASSYLLYSIWGYRPIGGGGTSTDDLLDQDLDPDVVSSADFRFNPVTRVNNTYNPVFNKTLLSNAFIEYSIIRNLKLRVSGGITQTDIRREIFNNSNTPAGSPLTLLGSTNGVNGSISNYNNTSLLNENTLSYIRNFNGHTIDVLGGFTAQKVSVSSDGYQSVWVPNESLGISGLEEGTLRLGEANRSSATLASMLGRINYHYKSKYYATFSMRADGSSKFAPGNRWGSFPSGSVAWKFSEEEFLAKSPFLSNGKIRASYGVIGNNRVSDFAYLSRLGINLSGNSANTTSSYPFNNSPLSGASPATIGNPLLKWETTATADIGVDLGFWNDRITLVVDYYYKKTTDLLLNAALAPTTGYMTAFKNIGSVSNRGLEITLSTVNFRKKDFSWSTDFNISFNRNKILQLNEGQPSLATLVAWNGNYNASQPYIAVPGMPIGMFYGFVCDGVYQLDDFDRLANGSYVLKNHLPNNGDARNTIKPGDIKYQDTNGDGLVNSLDQTIIGNPNPQHFGGINNNLAYKNLEVNIFFQWSYGNEVLNANRYTFEQARSQSNMFASAANRWTPENPTNDLFGITGGGPNVYSSRVIEDGSYLRLKTVSIGYNFENSVLKKLKIKALKVHASAQNLVTWTRYSGLNPDVSVRPSALTPGFDWSAYPLARTLVLGLNVTF